jgi:hypothetical protein
MPTPFECRVGGIIYHTTVEILSSVPESYFKVALSETWIPVGQTFLKIDRDGIHFQYILDFLRYGNLPRDSAGRCQIPKEILESVSVDADFYGLPVLVKEIEQLLKYDLKGMRYFISEFFLNSGASGGLSLKEFTSYEQAHKIYENYKNSCIQGLGRHVDNVIYGKAEDDDDDEEGHQNIVIIEKSDPATGKEVNEVFEDGNWKRPQGMEMLCIPLPSTDVKDGPVYTCCLRTHPDHRSYDF